MNQPIAGPFAHLAQSDTDSFDVLKGIAQFWEQGDTPISPDAYVCGLGEPIQDAIRKTIEQDSERRAIRWRDTALLIKACERLMADHEHLRMENGQPYIQNTGWSMCFEALRNFRVNGKHLADPRHGA